MRERRLAIQAFENFDINKVADGTYRNQSRGYSGDVHVAVTVTGRKITSVTIVKHKEKQYYSSLTDVPHQIIQKQGVKDVDTTTGATITARAIITASAKALAQGL